MKLQNLFKNLSYGELSNLAIGKDGSGEILEKDHPKIIQHINQGLMELYTRFILSEKHLIIEQVELITNYHLRSQYAESSDSNEPNKYIKDRLSDEPFKDDALKVLQIYDSLGNLMPLNDTENPGSVFTVAPITIQTPRPRHGLAMAIVYQARHNPLIDNGTDYLNQEINIPSFMEGALQSYVAGKVYGNMNGQEHAVRSLQHQADFQAVCDRTTFNDLVNNTLSTTTHKLEQRGFV